MPCTLSTHKNLEAEIERIRKKWQEAVEFNNQYPFGFVADLQERRSKENAAFRKEIKAADDTINALKEEIRRLQKDLDEVCKALRTIEEAAIEGLYGT